MEAHRLRPEIDLVVEQLEAPPARQPCPIRQHACCLMVEVRVDGPLRQTTSGRSPAMICASDAAAFGIDDRRAVDLAGENRLRAQDLARGLALGGANRRRFFVRFARHSRFAASEVDDRDGMSRAPNNGRASRRTRTPDRRDARRRKPR